MENFNTPPPIPAEPAPSRHGCFTAWLVLMLVTNTLTVISTLLMASRIQATNPRFTTGVLAIIVLAGVANIGFTIALFRWQRWGFYGFAASALMVLIVNLSVGVGITQSLLGLLGLPVLYLVMNIGGAKKAWPRLR